MPLDEMMIRGPRKVFSARDSFHGAVIAHPFAEEVSRLDFEAFRSGVLGVELGHVDRHRAIEVDGHRGQPPVVHEAAEDGEDELGACDGEGGDEDDASLREGALKAPAMVFEGGGGVEAVAVGGLDDQGVAGDQGVGVGVDGRVVATKVAGEDEGLVRAVVAGGADFDERGAEDVAGAVEAHLEVADAKGSPLVRLRADGWRARRPQR